MRGKIAVLAAIQSLERTAIQGDRGWGFVMTASIKTHETNAVKHSAGQAFRQLRTVRVSVSGS
jgi:hypothetical protein